MTDRPAVEHATGTLFTGLWQPYDDQLFEESVQFFARRLKEREIQAGGLAANKCRTFLDDLFCPKFDFYTWSRLRGMLEKRGFTEINRWPERTRLDHEVSLDTVKYFDDQVAAGRLDNTEAENLVIGQGHHRVLSRRG